MRRHHYRADALVEVLHAAQKQFNWLSPELLRFVGRALKLPLSHVYGVASFYHFFSLQPKGRHACVLCVGTACYVNGAAELVRAVEKQTGVKAGCTSKDGNFSLGLARCLGACGTAPAGVVDGELQGHLERHSLLQDLRSRVD